MISALIESQLIVCWFFGVIIHALNQIDTYRILWMIHLIVKR